MATRQRFQTRRFRWFYASAALAVALTACGGGGGGGGGGGDERTPTTPVTPPPPPPPPVFSLVVDAAPEPAVGIVGDPSDSVVRASVVFRYTVDQTDQGDRAWNIPEISNCTESESGESHCFTVAADPASGTVAADTPVAVTLALTCEREVSWQAPIEIVLGEGEGDAQATTTWNVSCENPPFDGELIGVEIYQGVFYPGVVARDRRVDLARSASNSVVHRDP